VLTTISSRAHLFDLACANQLLRESLSGNTHRHHWDRIAASEYLIGPPLLSSGADRFIAKGVQGQAEISPGRPAP
jgi:hypothetical protein